jgi:chromosomal replication initiator protein
MPWLAPLNPRFTFDTFIVGKSNELTHAAAVAVSTNPGAVYNPLVMYSDPGLGKTHLLHAIGHRLRSNGLSLISVTTEEFTNQYVDAIRIGKTNDFRNRYRSADVLLLDDLQFLMGKEQTQEGFFHTFNALHMTNRQIVITSDRPVTSLTLLADRMRSRLGGGLVVDIQHPDLETRLAILRTKAKLMGQDIPCKVLQFIADRFPSNIRELEGNLNRLAAYADLTNTPITLELAKRAIPTPIRPSISPYLSAQSIIKTIDNYLKLDVEALTGPRGKKEVSRVRQIAMYLLREDAGLGPTTIGRTLGGRNHSTVIKNCARMAQKIDAEPDLQRHVLNIRKALNVE